MLKFSRRDFIHAGCTALAASLVADPLEASIHGSALITVNAQRSVINVPTSNGLTFLNIAKTFNWLGQSGADLAVISSDGYPTAPLATQWGCNPSMPLGYYGTFIWSWSGVMSMEYAGSSIIVVHGGANFGLGADSGDIQSGPAMVSRANPSAEIQFGWNIQSISQSPTSNGSGGFLIRVHMKTAWIATNQFGSPSGQAAVQIVGANSNTGANGIWTAVDNNDNTTLDLLGSTFTNAQASAAGTTVFAPQGVNFFILAGGTVTSPSNLQIYKSTDATDVGNGLIWSRTLVTQLQTLFNSSVRGNPGWLRFMDWSGVLGPNYEGDFAQRMPKTQLSYGVSRYVKNYWCGTVTNTADAFTCSDPTVSVWDATNSRYFDGAIVQGVLSATNAGGNPTLAIGVHPAVPVLHAQIYPLIVTFNQGLSTASIAATGSSYTSGTGIVSLNLSAALTGSVGPSVGDTIVVSGATGTGADIGLVNGTFTATTGTAGTTINFSVGTGHTITTITGGAVADSTAATGQNLTFTFNAGGASWLNSNSNYVLNLTTQSTDTNPRTLALHLSNAVTGNITANAPAVFGATISNGSGGAGTQLVLAAPSEMVSVGRAVAGNTVVNGTTITAKIDNLHWTVSQSQLVTGQGLLFGPDPVLGATTGGAAPVYAGYNDQLPTPNAGCVLYPPTAQIGRLSISSLPSFATTLRYPGDIVSTIGSNNATFVYNQLLGAFIATSTGLTSAIPLEATVELCTRTNSHCWYNPGQTKTAYVTAVTNYFATNLVGLKLGYEYGNELWNANNIAPLNKAQGAALGWNLNIGDAHLSMQGLRTVQMAALSRAAWVAAGRANSDHYILSMNAIFDFATAAGGGGWDLKANQGHLLNAAANSVYATYGSMNGTGTIPTGASGYDTYPNRPVDVTDAVGCAPYWGSPWMGGFANFFGTQAAWNPLFQASLDFTNGLVSTAYTSLVNQFNGTVTRSDGVGNYVASVLGTANPLVNSSLYYRDVFTGYESIAASYDGTRPAGRTKLAMMHYEGGPNWAMGANFNNGVNSVNAADIAFCATAILNAGFDVRAFDASGSTNITTSATNVATQIITMSQAWKYDVSYKNLIKTSYYAMLASISGINREIHPGQFGYAGSQWGFYPVSFDAGNPYQNLNAAQEWNQ